MPAIISLSAQDALLDLIRTEFRNLPMRELLRLSPRVLLGVNDDAETALKTLDINTVFELATSLVFEAASKLLRAGTDVSSPLLQHGMPTADLVRESAVGGKRITELQFAPVDVLESIPAALVAGVQKALDAQTVRDLALYPPYRAALQLFNTIYFPENVVGFDPERPADLLPKTGEYPTERVQYTTLLMGEIPLVDGEELTDVTSKDFKPLELSGLAAGDAGFKHVAFGALLTYNQSWYAQGVTLGQLLHSTTLAPGESTRIAVVDWSRKSRAGETEVITETDDLTNDTTQNRSINEVTRAVAQEAQSGFSEANANSTSRESGTSAAGEISAPLGGLFGGPSGSMGSTSSDASTTSHADSYSTSAGRRDIASSMAQNINDRTHQHAHSSRARRASVVKEVSQSEHEGVSTRVIANYNHMHALTVQYYEVVQIYRVEVALKQADRVVFIPVQLIDFNNESLIRRFQGVLTRAALSFSIRDALTNLDVLQIAPDRETHFTFLGDRLSLVLSSALLSRRVPTLASTIPAPAPAPVGGLPLAPLARVARLQPVIQQVNDQLWSADQTARLSGLLNRSVLRANSNAIHLPTDVTVEGGSVSGGAPLKIVFHSVHGTTIDDVSADSPLALSEVSRIGLSGSSAERDVEATITLTVNRNGVRFPLELPDVTVKKGATGETKVVEIKPGGINANLKHHLNENRMYYSAAVVRALDNTQLAILLAPFGVTIEGKLVPVAQVVEPRPIRYIGNYLAFKMNTDTRSDRDFAKWLEDHGIVAGSAKEDIVPLPSGGTFAEAVLGRSNCAEKLDITRFWNWQDSPIPLQPTEIAAIQTGSRAASEDTKPGQFSNPIINITSPSSLPDPMGTAAVLAAVQNGNMFRDMSGLQGTIGLARAALQATSAGAATAGEQAGTNMNNLLKANTERQRIAAEMITSLARTAASAYTGGAVSPGGGISAGGHSQDGAKINYFDKTRDGAPGASDGTGSGGSVTPVAGGHSGGVGSLGAGGRSTAPGGGGYSENPAALAATWGDAEPRSALFEKILDKVDAGLTPLDDAGIAIGADAGAAPVVPFPAASAEPLTASAKLQAALDKAVSGLELKRALPAGSFEVRFTFADITSGAGPFPSAGFRETDTDYIASEAKVSVMYSAYALRDMVRRFAAATKPSVNELFEKVAAQMNPSIRSAIPAIAGASNLSNAQRDPNYKAAFTATAEAGGLKVEFSPAFANSLEAMIVPSNNDSAAACVHGIGYGYLNGALAAGGFFDIASSKGLWVGGDFQDEHVWPYVRINSMNDKGVAQAGTTRDMTRLMCLISTKQLIDTASCDEMLGRLNRAAKGIDTPWAARPGVLKAGTITHNKLGLGPLKTNVEVRSEVSVMDAPVAAGRRYVVAWQNLAGMAPVTFGDVATLIKETITDYEKP